MNTPQARLHNEAVIADVKRFAEEPAAPTGFGDLPSSVAERLAAGAAAEDRWQQEVRARDAAQAERAWFIKEEARQERAAARWAE